MEIFFWTLSPLGLLGDPLLDFENVQSLGLIVILAPLMAGKEVTTLFSAVAFSAVKTRGVHYSISLVFMSSPALYFRRHSSQ